MIYSLVVKTLSLMIEKFNGSWFLMIEEFDGWFLIRAFLTERDCMYFLRVSKIKVVSRLDNQFGPIVNGYFLQKTNSILYFSRQMQVTIQVYARQL